MKNWYAYLVGGSADLVKYAMPGRTPVPELRFAVMLPLDFKVTLDVIAARMPRDVYRLRYADEPTRTALYIFDRRED